MPTDQFGSTYRITSGDQQVTVREIGARLESYVKDGVEVAPPPPVATGVRDGYRGGRGQVLMPWPNRVRDGKYEVDGVGLQLPINEVAKNNASHGFIRSMPFAVAALNESEISLSCQHFAMPGYPFTFRADITYSLSEDGLTVTMAATNTGDLPLPFGVGVHPYFTAGGATADESSLRFSAHSTVPVDERSIPTGALDAVQRTEYDFTEERSLNGAVIDICYAGLGRDENGLSTVTLTAADHWTEVWMDESFDYLVVFTGDTLAEAERRKSVAIEPMSCAADAFNNGLGLRMLQPGGSFNGSWGVRAGRSGSAT